jgi:predicted flap endonuclease-1-like 5' DNA nuclease
MKNSRGWAAFGAILMMVVGVFQILSGIFGLVNDQWVILGYSGYFLVDVTGLAVWYIAIGAVLLLGGIAVVQGSRIGRIVGVVAASLAIVSQLLVLQVHPVWSVLLIALYVMALIAFMTVKGPLEPADEESVALVDEEAVVPPALAVPPAPVAAAASLIAEAPAVAPEPMIAAAPIFAAAAVAPEPATSAAPVVAPVVAPAVTTEEPVVRQTYDLTDIEGIGPVFAEKLGDLGLKTTDDLLKVGASPKGREDLALASGISGKLILRWVNMADLFRIKGVGEQYSDLLEAAGVDTVPELAQRRADNLTLKMAEVNEEKQLVRRRPTEDEVAGWIESAKSLPRVVTY